MTKKPNSVTAKEIVDYLKLVEQWFKDAPSVASLQSWSEHRAKDVASKRTQIENSILSATKIS